MEQKTMKRNKALLITLIFAILVTAISPVLAEIPVYVEREKDEYFFKIHGTPNPSKADYIYKNLSPHPQTVTIRIIQGGILKSSRTWEVGLGGQFEYYYAAASGSIVDFEVIIDIGAETIVTSGSIIIPPA
jgi:hypothetical protein